MGGPRGGEAWRAPAAPHLLNLGAARKLDSQRSRHLLGQRLNCLPRSPRALVRVSASEAIAFPARQGRQGQSHDDCDGQGGDEKDDLDAQKRTGSGPAFRPRRS